MSVVVNPSRLVSSRLFYSSWVVVCCVSALTEEEEKVCRAAMYRLGPTLLSHSLTRAGYSVEVTGSVILGPEIRTGREAELQVMMTDGAVGPRHSVAG